MKQDEYEFKIKSNEELFNFLKDAKDRGVF